jgi:large subunit ribosomal protein L21e
MPHSHGYNAGTRDMMSRPFRGNGMPGMSKYLTKYKIGDFVDIKANSAVHGGRPHKIYHGRTGQIFNITRRSCGVIVNKRLGPKTIPKRIHFRVEHLTPSTSKDEIKRRVVENEAQKAAARKGGAKVGLKRIPKQPAAAFNISATENVTYAAPEAYSELV